MVREEMRGENQGSIFALACPEPLSSASRSTARSVCSEATDLSIARTPLMNSSTLTAPSLAVSICSNARLSVSPCPCSTRCTRLRATASSRCLRSFSTACAVFATSCTVPTLASAGASFPFSLPFCASMRNISPALFLPVSSCLTTCFSSAPSLA